jgi:hypothetical protein
VSRDARTGPGRNGSASGKSAGSARRSAAVSRGGAAGSGPVPSRSRRGGAGGPPDSPATPSDGLVVGGEELRSATGIGGVLAALLVPAAHLAVGVLLLRGVAPKFGLAYAGIAGALALGQLLIEIYRGSSSTDRPGVEVIAGERVLTSSVDVGAGWVLGVVALALTVAAGACAVAAWGRTVMDDGGSLDPIRPGLAGTAVLLGVATVLSLALPAADVPDRLVTDPSTGLQTVVTQEGPQALLERPGLALLGGLLLAGALVLCSVIAPSLRPRLAAVGGLLAIAVVVLTAALTGMRDAVASADLEWTLPGVALLVVGLGYAALTALAWRLRRTPA